SLKAAAAWSGMALAVGAGPGAEGVGAAVPGAGGCAPWPAFCSRVGGADPKIDSRASLRVFCITARSPYTTIAFLNWGWGVFTACTYNGRMKSSDWLTG